MVEEEIVYSEKKKRDYLTGTSGVLLIHIAEEESVEAAIERLKKLVSFIPKVPGVSVTILTTSDNFVIEGSTVFTPEHDFVIDEIIQGINSINYVNTSVDVFRVSTILNVNKSIESLAKISRNFDIDSIPGLNIKLIRDFVEDFLVEYFFNEVYYDLRERQMKGWKHCASNDLIGLFNDIIDHLLKVIANEELKEISWPIPELKKLVLDEEIPSYWNDFPYLEQVRTWISNLRLPLMKPIKEISDLDQYLSMISKSYSAFSVAHTRIQSALAGIKRKNLSLDEIPWTDIVHALIDYKIGQRSTMDPFSNHGSDMVVVYLEHNLTNFKSSKPWLRSNQGKPFESEAFAFEASKSDNHDSELLQCLKSELNSSLQFEKTLEAMVMNEDYELNKSNDEDFLEENDENLEDDEMMVKSVHFPVVSIISPNLGMIAGSKALQQRVNFVAKKRAIEVLEDETKELKEEKPKKVMKSHLVQSLHEKANEELNSSMNFEQKLLAALNN